MTVSAEANVLHAIIEGNEEEARTMLRDFLPGELKALYHQANTLAGLCEVEHKRQLRNRQEGSYD